MSDVRVRPFRRADRDQLTRLVNAHADAVVPGMSASVNTVLSSLERQPGEFIVDPWVSERVTLVAEQRNRVTAAAHLLRYYPDDRAGESARDAGEIRWLLYWPLAPAGNRPGPAAGPTSATCTSRPRTTAAAWDPGCSARPPAGRGEPPAQLRLAGGHRSRRAELRRLPGLPARRGFPRADPDRARVDPGVSMR